MEIHQNDRIPWLAGILEGEGSFYLRTYKSGTTQPRIQMASTDMDLATEVARTIGSPVYGPYKGGKGSIQLVYQVAVQGDKAIDVMKLIYPLMSKRRKEKIDEVCLRHRDRWTT